jgi:hypothetical protein
MYNTTLMEQTYPAFDQALEHYVAVLPLQAYADACKALTHEQRRISARNGMDDEEAIPLFALFIESREAIREALESAVAILPDGKMTPKEEMISATTETMLAINPLGDTMNRAVQEYLIKETR